MKNRILIHSLLGIAILFGNSGVVGQSGTKDSQKEIIIIERTVDPNGNIISRSVTRQNGDELTDEELQKIIDGTDGPTTVNPRFYDWSFGENFDQNMSPTLGISLSFKGDKAIVAEVMPGSDAFEEDIRKGDHLLSINLLPISSFDDVQEALKGRNVGDEVDVNILRDGQSLDKKVELRYNRFGEMGFTFPDGFGRDGFFFELDDKGSFKLFADSLLRGFDIEQFIPQLRSGAMPDEDDKAYEEKGQLGVFIEDTADGVLVTEVIPESPADLAGIKTGDIIKSVNDEVVTSYSELSMVMRRKVKGDKVTLKLRKADRSIQNVEVQLN